MNEVGVLRDDANGITVPAAATTGNGPVEPECSVFEMVGAGHLDGAAFDQLARGIDSTVVEFDGDVVGLDLTEMDAGPDAHFRADGQLSIAFCVDLLDVD
jgi:hypothetical protein